MSTTTRDRVLAALYRAGATGMTVAELADAVGRPQRTVTNAIRFLRPTFTPAFVERVPSDKQAGPARWRLTTLGHLEVFGRTPAPPDGVEPGTRCVVCHAVDPAGGLRPIDPDDGTTYVCRAAQGCLARWTARLERLAHDDDSGTDR